MSAQHVTSRTTLHHTGAKIAVAAAVALAAVVAAASPAAAHVTVDPGDAPAGGFARLAFRVPHGCDGSATVAVRIQIPEGAQSVAPEAIAGWEAETITEQLDPPIEGAHGEQLTERVTELVWQGGPLADDQFLEFGVSLRLPEGDPGDMVWFPTIQECEQGETAWITIPADGEDEPDEPAPGVRLTAADSDHGHDGGADGAAGDDDATTEPDAGAEGDGEDVAALDLDAVATDSDVDGARTVGIVGIVVGAIGLLAGAGALVASRRRTS